MPQRNWPSSSGSYVPITYIRGLPIDLTTVLVCAHVLAMLGIALFLAFTPHNFQAKSMWMQNIYFSTDFWITHRYWTFLTYPFLHVISVDHVWFAVEMVMLYWFGREVERFIGRVSFGIFYAALVLGPPLFFWALSPWIGPSSLAESRILHFGVFLGFVIIYPNVQFYWSVSAKWLAWVFLAIYSLYYLVRHDWLHLGQLSLTAATAYFYMQHVGAGRELGLLQWFQSWRQELEEQKFKKRREAYEAGVRRHEESVDAILEKISEQGMGSLTPAERVILEKASHQLARREKENNRG